MKAKLVQEQVIYCIYFVEEDVGEESGMEFLLKKEGTSDAESNPDQELTSAAATAESLQPTGFTLETAHVRSENNSKPHIHIKACLKN